MIGAGIGTTLEVQWLAAVSISSLHRSIIITNSEIEIYRSNGENLPLGNKERLDATLYFDVRQRVFPVVVYLQFLIYISL